MQQKERDAFKGVNFSALGEAIVLEAKKLLHEKHLAGEFDPSWQSCLQEAQKIVLQKFITAKRKGGKRMEKEKTVSETDELRRREAAAKAAHEQELWESRSANLR